MAPKTPTSPAPPPPAAFRGAPKGLRRLVLEYGRPRLTALPTSKERIIDFLKTIVWVVPMTLLIWIYAERDQYVSDSGQVACPIEIQTTSDRAVWFIEQPEHRRQANLLIRLEGPHSGVLAVESDIFKARPGQPPVQIKLGPEYDPGDYLLDTRGLINNNPLFVRNGVTVKECQPDKIKVNVEKMESRLQAIQPRLPKNVNGTVTFDPPQVMVRAPTSYFREPEDAQAEMADLTNFPMLQQDGSHKLLGVPLTSVFKEIYGEDLSFNPTTVTADVSTSLRTSEWTIPSIRVDVVMPPGLEEKYVVRFVKDVSVYDVNIKGPPQDIEKIKNSWDKPEKLQLRALLNIRLEDTQKGDVEITHPVQIDALPTGVSLVGNTTYQVTFKLVARAAETP